MKDKEIQRLLTKYQNMLGLGEWKILYAFESEMHDDNRKAEVTLHSNKRRAYIDFHEGCEIVKEDIAHEVAHLLFAEREKIVDRYGHYFPKSAYSSFQQDLIDAEEYVVDKIVGLILREKRK